MPRYAVLGATGNTGRALIQVLLQSPSNQVNAFCRSKPKLLQVSPCSVDNKQVSIFEGSLDNEPLLAECMRGTNAVFLAVAVIDNMPGCTIAQDTAKAVLIALDHLKSEPETIKMPRLIVLSTASLEDSFCSDVPAGVHTVLNTAVSYLYADLAAAEKLLRAQQSWITTVFVKPGGLVNDKQKGHCVSTVTAKTPLSFLDLAAGMVEIAEADSCQYDMKNVSVVPLADDVLFPWDGVYFVFTGLLYHFMPWTYRYLGEYRMRS